MNLSSIDSSHIYLAENTYLNFMYLPSIGLGQRIIIDKPKMKNHVKYYAEGISIFDSLDIQYIILKKMSDELFMEIINGSNKIEYKLKYVEADHSLKSYINM